MDNRVSITMRKMKSSAPAKQVMNEYLRDEKTADRYDNSNRELYVERTKDNVILARPEIENYDELRNKRIEDINIKKKELDIDRGRKLRKDTVDTVEHVVQFSKEYCDSKSEEEIKDEYTAVYHMMSKYPEDYGHIDCAVIHVDETTPHMQIMASTLDHDNCRSMAKDIFGNKTKMSNNQTVFAERCKEEAELEVERGIQRVNSTYKDQLEEVGLYFGEDVKEQVTEQNDYLVFEMMNLYKQKKEEQEQELIDERIEYLKENEETAKMLSEWEEELESKQLEKEYLEQLQVDLESREQALKQQVAEINERERVSKLNDSRDVKVAQMLAKDRPELHQELIVAYNTKLEGQHRERQKIQADRQERQEMKDKEQKLDKIRNTQRQKPNKSREKDKGPELG